MTAAASATAPVAVAGDDRKVLTLASVTLDGSLSRGGSLTYLWEQTGGATVTLATPTSATTTFGASVSAGTLTFRLTVWNAEGSDSDVVEVAVKKMLVTADDQWFVGYGNSGNVTATVSGGTGPFDYEWAGVESWLTLTTPTVTTGTTSTTNDLGYTAPPFGALQGLAQEFRGVTALSRAAQGRLQLKVKVTDNAGASDEDLVNFSVGPFPNSVMGTNVPLGEPVFVSGAADWAWNWYNGWAWSGTKPDGMPIDFYAPGKAPLATDDQRSVYFVPDQVGRYRISVVHMQNGTVFGTISFDIICGTFVGVGTLLGKTPDHVKGECGGCHRGAAGWLADLQTPWEQTAHARAYSRLLDPADALHAESQAKRDWRDAFDFASEFSISERTVGWSRISAAANGGWAERAEAEKYAFKGTSWAELKRKYPETAEMSNVQCESCHGPGSRHLGDRNGISVNYDTPLCGRCHPDEAYEWQGGEHSGFHNSEAPTKADCNHCHTAKGFAVEMRSQVGATTFTVLRRGPNPARPAMPLEKVTSMTCQGCHDPHRKSGRRTATGADHQLRAYGRVRFQEGTVVDLGDAAICALCHQSMVDSRVGSRDFLERRAPHSSTAAEMALGIGGMRFEGWTYNSSAHADPAKFRVPGQTESRWCLACHWDPQPAKGTPAFGQLGGHTTDTYNFPAGYFAAGCVQCHPVSGDLNLMARDDYDGDGTVGTVIVEYQNLRTTLENAVGAKLNELVPGATWAGVDDDIGLMQYRVGAPRTYPGPFSNNPDIDWWSLTDDRKKEWENVYMAHYNWEFIWQEESDGVHNLGYAVNLMQSSIRALYPNAIPNAKPYVPYP